MKWVWHELVIDVRGLTCKKTWLSFAGDEPADSPTGAGRSGICVTGVPRVVVASTLKSLTVIDRRAYSVPSTRKPIRLQLVVATGTALALAVTVPGLTAHADPVYPSAGQVKAAQAAVGDKAAQISVIEGQLKASNARLEEVQSAAEVASEKYNLARLLLEQATAAAKAAGERAAAAQEIADIASNKLGQFAAATYMQGGNLGQLEAFLSSKGPQDVLDRAAGIQLITDIRNQVMQDADAASVVAGVLRRQTGTGMWISRAGAGRVTRYSISSTTGRHPRKGSRGLASVTCRRLGAEAVLHHVEAVEQELRLTVLQDLAGSAAAQCDGAALHQVPKRVGGVADGLAHAGQRAAQQGGPAIVDRQQRLGARKVRLWRARHGARTPS